MKQAAMKRATMKRPMIALLGALLFAGAAQAAQPQTTSAPAADAPAPQEQAKKQDLSDRHCLRHTGTRITHRKSTTKDTCSNGSIGRAYTREELDRTGRVDIADALRTLDPSIR